MKNSAKLFLVVGFGLFAVVVVGAFGVRLMRSGVAAMYMGLPTPTPGAANSNTASNTNSTGSANASANAIQTPAAGGDKSIPKTFTLARDSLDPDYHEVAFNHDNHAFLKYSADGTSVMGCVECHHTDQPKSALKPPLVTSEREVALTNDVFKTSTQKVSDCRACHFQDGSAPEGKTMPTLNGKDLNNQNAYHTNCNTCHDSAAKLRPELKSKPGFATGKDCAKCHKTGA